MSVGYLEEWEAIQTHFAARWDFDACPVAFPNVGFTPPVDAPWARFTIVDGAGGQVDLGEPGPARHRYAGVVMMQVFIPTRIGTGVGWALAQTACDALRRALLLGAYGEIRFRTPSASLVEGGGPVKATEAGAARGWAQINVTAEFERDTVHG